MAENSVLNTNEYTRLHPKAIHEIESYQALLKKFNIQCNTYSPSSLKKLLTVAEGDLLEKITSNFSILKEVLQDTEITDTETETDDNSEIEYAKRALSKFGMRVPDEFWTQVKKDEIIEIYGTDMIQKYRSTNFYDLTSYSLLDLVINEWYVLWERPSSTLDEMMAAVKELFAGQTGAKKPNVKKHLVKEIYNQGVTEPFIPRCLLVDFQWIIPTYKSVGNEMNGLVITSTCRPVSVGFETTGVDFI